MKGDTNFATMTKALGLVRIGKSHNAGSDEHLTVDCFYRILAHNHDQQQTFSFKQPITRLKGILLAVWM